MLVFIRKSLKYFNTIRYLKPVQIYGRLLRKIWRPKMDFLLTPQLRDACFPWTAPIKKPRSFYKPDKFILLNEHGSLSEHGWDGVNKSKLWRYNQHYFETLNSSYNVQGCVDYQLLINCWINENTNVKGTGWEPYPVSLRIVNWVKFSLNKGHLNALARHSLSIQAGWLAKNVEWHLLGNHLLANAKALIFASLYFKGPKAENWRDLAISIFERELDEQVLADGGHFELSPMYHAIILEDILDLINIFSVYETSLSPQEKLLKIRLVSLVPKMLQWLHTMTHPDGKISFFNDAALDIAPATNELFSYTKRLGIEPKAYLRGLMHLMNTGYARMEMGSATVICDIGKIGPDYNPGHGHADALSFELSIENERLIVNSGISQYGEDEERLRQRGTSAHSTVVYGKENSSEIWGGFRVAKRANVKIKKINQKAESIIISATHDGYRRLANGPYHNRTWRLDAHRILIIDRLYPRSSGMARFHLPAGVSVNYTGARDGTFQFPSDKVLTWTVSNHTNMEIENTSWHPCFGYALDSQCLVFEFSGSLEFEIYF